TPLKPGPDRRDGTSPRRWQPPLHGASHPAISWTPLRGHTPSITDENTLSLRPRPRFFRLDCPEPHDYYVSPYLNQARALPTWASLQRALVLGFELADHSLGLVVEGGEDLVGVLFRAVKSRTADRESMTSWPF